MILLRTLSTALLTLAVALLWLLAEAFARIAWALAHAVCWLDSLHER